jgi:N,N'-diacetyllegionaminate synthase
MRYRLSRGFLLASIRPPDPSRFAMQDGSVIQYNRPASGRSRRIGLKEHSPSSDNVDVRSCNPSSPAFLIAEAGVNHNGRLDLALDLVAAARRAGADAVKFQTFRAASLVAPGAARAPYQGQGGQLEMLRALELPDEAFGAIRDRCREEGIEFLSTPFDERSADLLHRLGVRRFKVSSGDLTDLPLLARIGSFRLPVILSTGMGEDREVADALDVLRTAGAPEVVLLHCITSYPAAPEDLQLLRIPALAGRFGCPVGYSDHSVGEDAALAARALGAIVIEKHLTLDRGLPGPDHAASAEPEDFARLVERVRRLESMLGGPSRRITAEEARNRSAARKSVTALSAIPAGREIRREDLAVRRPGTGIPPGRLGLVVGRRAARDIAEGEPIRWDLIVGGDPAAGAGEEAVQAPAAEIAR